MSTARRAAVAYGVNDFVEVQTREVAVTGRVRRSGTALWRRMPDRILVHDRAEIHDLRGPAVAVWALLAEPQTLDQIVAELGDRFVGDRADIAADTATLLEQLRALGVVEVAR